VTSEEILASTSYHYMVGADHPRWSPRPSFQRPGPFRWKWEDPPVLVDGTLAAIDSALQDWDTGGDAMRWQPDPDRVICEGAAISRPGPRGRS
jgi:hypothetical protein